MKKKELYCCSSYYQILVALMKAMRQDSSVDLVLEVHGIETAEQLKASLKRIPQVEQVYVCPDHPDYDPYLQREAILWPVNRRRLSEHMEQVFGRSLAAGEYQTIHVFWDLGYCGTYLNLRKIHYTLHEDSLNSYQHIRENRPHYRYLFHKIPLFFALKKIFPLGVLPFGYSDCCDVVEVNCREKLEIPLTKVQECSREKLMAELTAEQKRELFAAFLPELKTGETGENGDAKRGILILTEPFARTERLPDREVQAQLYRDLIQEYGRGVPVYLKAHPRDDLDYEALFPEVHVLPKLVPTEVLNFDESFCFSKAITVTSSAVQGILRADERIYLGVEFLRRYQKS